MTIDSTDTNSWATSPGVRKSMQGNRHRDTKPELAVRTLLHKMGHRYRVDVRPEVSIRRKADLVFTRIKLAVFIDGCFWHGCNEHFVKPKSNMDYWDNKIGNNIDRDRETNSLLEERGWSVVRIWTHTDPHDAALHIDESVREIRARVKSAEPVATRFG